MRVRHVTTAFVQQSTDEKVLLLLRSDRVRTFKRHWAGVSGSVESGETPLRCAKRELAEEIGMDPDRHLRLIRSGRPLCVVSRDYETTFVVHPFLFRESSPGLLCNMLRIDWEHSRYEYVDPEELLSDRYSQRITVPNLHEAFRRVYPPQHIRELLSAIVDNKTDGAANITRFALQNVIPVAFLDIERDSLLEDRMRDIAFWLDTARPTMAPIGNASCRLMSQVLKKWKRQNDADNRKVLLNVLIKKEAERMIHQMETAADKIADKVERLCQEQIAVSGRSALRVLTISYSSTVCNVISQMMEHGLVEEVLVSESRPACEGLHTIRSLRRKNQHVKLTLFTEAALSNVILMNRSVDMIIVGCDSALPDGGFVNKTGSHLLASLAKLAELPMLVCCDAFKVRDAESEKEIYLEHGPSRDLLGQDDLGIAGLNIYNPIFEYIPSSSCAKLITETDQAVEDIAKGFKADRSLLFEGALML